MNYRIRQSGFTLLELLLASAMGAMLLATLFTSLQIASGAQRRTTVMVEPARAVQVALDLARSDVHSVLPPTGILAGAFTGTTDTVEFFCAGTGPETADAAGTDGIRKMQIAIVGDDDTKGRVLVRRITTNLLSPQVSEPHEEVICRDVRRFAIRYFDGESWMETWDSTTVDNALPLALEISLAIDHPGQSEGQSVEPYASRRVFTVPCYRRTVVEGGEQ